MLPTLFTSGPFITAGIGGAVVVGGAALVKAWQDRDLLRPRLAASIETRRRASEQRKHLNQAAAGVLRNKDLGTGENGGRFASRRRSADEVSSL
ncbi:hypothetical protein ACWGJ9_10720 [Curtobacterium citreum]